jgi:hypothetical protein
MAEVTHTTEDQKKVQGSITTNGQSLTLSRFTTWGAVGIQVTGTWTGTLTFNVSVDGSTFTTVSLTPSNSVTLATSTTANGVWYIANCFFQSLQVAATAAITGTAVVTIISRPSQY